MSTCPSPKPRPVDEREESKRPPSRRRMPEPLVITRRTSPRLDCGSSRVRAGAIWAARPRWTVCWTKTGAQAADLESGYRSAYLTETVSTYISQDAALISG